MVRIIFGFAIATVMLLVPHAALAQKGQQIFDLFLQGAQQELNRQQQREHERHQRQELNRLHQQFVVFWRACFGNDLGACDQALAYPHLNFTDRQRLIGKRSEIVSVRQEAAERVRRERIEAEYEERRRHREREQQAERERDRDLARQREDAERQRQRAEQVERHRQAAFAQPAAVRETHSLREEQPQKNSVLVSSWTSLAAVAAIGVLLTLVYFFRGALLTNARHLRDVLARLSSSLPLGASALKTSSQSQAAGQSGPPKDNAADKVGNEREPPIPAAEERPRDTLGAIAAMELAYAFIEEIRVADMPGLEDKEARRHHLNTLALASRQLGAAERCDPDAVLDGADDKEIPYRFSINELKAEALLLEGLTHQVYNLRRAIPALVAATKANPNNARAFYVLGLTHAANRNKGAAVTAFRSAVQLDPRNIVFRKELSRAESLSAAEIAGYKATRAGERIFDAGIATANAGIMAWNVFAIVWNIVTFPLRMVFAIFRLLRLHPFA